MDDRRGDDMKLLYLVHDLRDPAVERRLRMLADGGVRPVVLGFHRGAAVAAIDGIAATSLGATANGKLARRVWSVMQAASRLHRWGRQFCGADVIVARNLEMLLLAALARRRFAPGAAIVYECLDVHTALVGNGSKGKLLRRLEEHLLRGCQMLIVSSPAFVARHFAARYATVPPVLLLENKLLRSEVQRAESAARPAAPPWRIGWYGVIRCRRSLHLLAGLLRERPGLLEVVIRGRPALTVLPDFHDIVAATPGMSFLGPYDRGHDLPQLYGNVHFTWAIDFYEAGANSAWLLPNRLYEGSCYSAVPLALGSVATGAWLAARNAGAVLEEPLADGLARYFDALNAAGYASAAASLAEIPVTEFVAGRAEAERFVARLAALAPASCATKALNPA